MDNGFFTMKEAFRVSKSRIIQASSSFSFIRCLLLCSHFSSSCVRLSVHDLQLENLALMSTPLHPYATFKNSTPHFHIPSISLTFVMRPDTKMEGAFFTSDAYGTAI